MIQLQNNLTPSHAVTANGNASVLERSEDDTCDEVTILDADFSTDADNTSDFEQHHLFAGYRHDAESGLYEVRNRMLHPTLGRWMQRDPLGYVDSMNTLEYCTSRSLTLVDPFGLLHNCGECDTRSDTGAHNLRIAGIVRTPIGADPWDGDIIDDFFDDLERFENLKKILDAIKTATGAARSIKDLLDTLAGKIIDDSVPTIDPDTRRRIINQFWNAFLTNGYDLFVMVEFEECSPCDSRTLLQRLPFVGCEKDATEGEYVTKRAYYFCHGGDPTMPSHVPGAPPSRAAFEDCVNCALDSDPTLPVAKHGCPPPCRRDKEWKCER